MILMTLMRMIPLMKMTTPPMGCGGAAGDTQDGGGNAATGVG